MGKFYIPFNRVRIVICAAFALCALAAPAYSQDNALFTVNNVKVDLTDKSAVAARDKAFIEAQQAAFKQLAERVMPPDALATFTPPEPQIIAPLIQDFEITEEHLSKVRYVGVYAFRFDEVGVRQFFNQRGVMISTVVHAPALVLPFFQWGSRTILWDEERDNPWRAAWGRVNAFTAGTIPVALPIGDIEDVSDIGDTESLTFRPDTVMAMAQRYGADSAAVAIAAPAWNSGSDTIAAPDALSVALYAVTPSGPEYIDTVKVARAEGQDAAMLYDAGVTAARAALQTGLAALSPATIAGGEVLYDDAAAVESAPGVVARVRFAAMAEWLEVQRALRSVTAVREFKLLSLTPNEAYVELFHDVDRTVLDLSLARAGLMLTNPQAIAPPVNPYLPQPPISDPAAQVYDLRFDQSVGRPMPDKTY